MDKYCANCYWNDQCACVEVCDDYTPIDKEEEIVMAIEEYIDDLEERHEVYEELLEEQDG